MPLGSAKVEAFAVWAQPIAESLRPSPQSRANEARLAIGKSRSPLTAASDV